MISYYNMTGRLGNIILCIYKTFLYCYRNNIDYNNIKFDRNGFCDWAVKYFNKNFPFFKNIEKYFIDHVEYNFGHLLIKKKENFF